MPEILLHYIWQQRIFAAFKQFTTDGREIEIISTGQHNTDAGPDFTNVHIRIYDSPSSFQDWYGNVEIHVLASDWYKHHHQHDHAYDSVILHVVRKADKQVFNSNGNAIIQCELRYPEQQDYLSSLFHAAQQMDSNAYGIRCAEHLLHDPELLSAGWKQTMLMRQINCKQASIKRLMTITHNSWEQAFYISLAHYFGFHTNGIPFESLAIATPLAYIQKHRNSLFQLTALLLGQSGLLRQETATTHEKQLLLREYLFLANKFSLTPINHTLWKAGRMRPQNSPEVRIRQFACLLFRSEFLFSSLMEAADINALRQIFIAPTLSPDQKTELPPTIGRSSADTLIMNAVVPFRYAYYMAYSQIDKAQDALHMLTLLPSEDNRIIRLWAMLGQRIQSAADSQALLHLYKHFCQDHLCINCEVAYQVFITHPA